MSPRFFAKLRQLKVEAPMAAKVGMGQKFANIAYLATIGGCIVNITFWTFAYLTEYYYDTIFLHFCEVTGTRRNGRKHNTETRSKWLNIKYPLRHTSKLETESMRKSTLAILASFDHECHKSSCAKVAARRKALKLTCNKLPVYVLMKALAMEIYCPCQARSVTFNMSSLLSFAERAVTRRTPKRSLYPIRMDPDKELDEAEIGTYIRSNYASAIMAELLARLSLRVKYSRKRGASVKVDTVGQMYLILVDDRINSGTLLRGWLWLNRAMCFSTNGIKMMISSNIFCDFDSSRKSICEKYQRKLQKWNIYNREDAESHVLQRFFNDCNGTNFSYSDMFCTLFESHMNITRVRNQRVNLSASMISAPCFSNTFYNAVDRNLMDVYKQLVLYPSASIWTGNVVLSYSGEYPEVVRGGLVTSVRMQSLLLIGLYVGLLAACLGLGIVHSEALSDVNVDPTSLTSLMAVVLALGQQVLMSFWGEDMTWGDFLRGRRVVYKLTHKMIRKTGVTSTEFIRQLMINKSLGQILMAEHRTCFLPYKCSGNSYFAFHVTPRMLACTGAAIYTDTYSARSNGINGLLVQKVSTEYRSEKRHFRQYGRAALWYNLRTVEVSNVSCPQRLTWHVEDSKRELPKTELYVVTFHNISVMGGTTVSHNMSENSPAARTFHLQRGECAHAACVNGNEYLMAVVTNGKKNHLCNGDVQKVSDIFATVYIVICGWRGPCSTGSTMLLANVYGVHSNDQLKRDILKNRVANLVRHCNGIAILPGGEGSASLILKLRDAKKLWQEHGRIHIVKGESYILSPAILRKFCSIVIRQAINVELCADLIDLTNDDIDDLIELGEHISNITKHQLINEPLTEVDITNRSFMQMALMSAAPASSPAMTSTTVLLSH